jgi:hypothetical protein
MASKGGTMLYQGAAASTAAAVPNHAATEQTTAKTAAAPASLVVLIDFNAPPEIRGRLVDENDEAVGIESVRCILYPGRPRFKQKCDASTGARDTSLWQATRLRQCAYQARPGKAKSGYLAVRDTSCLLPDRFLRAGLAPFDLAWGEPSVEMTDRALCSFPGIHLQT